MCKKSKGRPLTWPQMEHAIKRNFGGLKSDKLDPFEEFRTRLNMAEEKPIPDDYDDFEEACDNSSACLGCSCTYLCRLSQSSIPTVLGLVSLRPVWIREKQVSMGIYATTLITALPCF